MDRLQTSINRIYKRDRLLSIVAGMFTVLVVLLATFRVDIYERERFLNTQRIEAVQYASVLRAQLESALNARLHLANGLAAYAKSHHNTDITHFSDFAIGLMETGIPGIRSLQLAPNAVVTHVYPVKGNENIVGHDLLADPARREAVERTIRERLFVVAGPFKLIQGGIGLVARLPLYNDEPDGRFWGFATVVLDIGPILAEGGIHPPANTAFSVAIRGKDSLGADGAVFVGDSKLFQLSPVTMDVTLPHGSWQLGVEPKAGWPDSSPYSPYIWTFGCILAYFAGSFMFMLVNEPKKLRREVEKATSALREREEQFRRVAESASDAMISTDSDRRITFWNHAATTIFGYSPDEALNRDVLDLLVPADHRAVLADLLGPPANGNGQHAHLFETTGIHRDLRQFPIELTTSHWKSGGRTFHTLIIRDVTDRKQAEQEQAVLRDRYFHAQKMEAIGQLASGTAHEFNNTLNSLIANAEAAIAELPPESEAAQPMYEVLNCGWRAAEIVRQLLVFSEKGGEDMAILSPYATINQLMSRLKAQLPANIALVEHVSPITSHVAMDYDQFCHLVWNLFMNGCKAMLPGGGTLTVTLEEVDKTDSDFTAHASHHPEGCNDCSRLAVGELRPGRFIRFQVSDTGCGMDQATLSKAFDPFFTTSPVGAGSGLGLSVVHGVVQSQGGGILVCSGKSKGTSFEIYLPVAEIAQAD